MLQRRGLIASICGRFSRKVLAVALAGAACVFGAEPSWAASNPYLEIPTFEEARASRAYTYANLTNEQAYAELRARGIGFESATPPLPGVRAPIRLTGPLHGVTIRSTLSPEQVRRTPYEILDARLALALDDFCKLLADHDIVELVHFTMYRPAGEKVGPDALHAQTRHPGGLAIDVGGFRKRSGHFLAVGPHWPGERGAKTCGESARAYRGRPARELVSIVCEAADSRIFHYMLTPHFDKAHADHFHLEIKPGVKWFLVN